MAAKHFFDLERRHVLAAADDDFFLAADKEYVAFLIHPAEIARMKPAIDNGFSRRFLIAEIAEHHCRRTDDEFAGALGRQEASLLVDHSDFLPRKGLPDRTDLAAATGLKRIERARRRAFRQAPSLDQDVLAEPVLEARREFDRQRRGARLDEIELDARIARFRLAFQKNGKHRGRRTETVDVVVGHQPPMFARAELAA